MNNQIAQERKQALAFRKLYNQFVNANRFLLFNKNILLMTKALAWKSFKETGASNFENAITKAREIQLKAREISEQG